MIDEYDFGYMVIDGKRYTSDCIATEDSIDASWWRKNAHELAIEDIKETIERHNPQIIVVGKGKYGIMKILPETEQYLKDKEIEIVADATDAAIKRYNELAGNKTVVGFFHLTC